MDYRSDEDGLRDKAFVDLQTEGSRPCLNGLKMDCCARKGHCGFFPNRIKTVAVESVRGCKHNNQRSW